MELRTEETFAERYVWLELAKARKLRLPLWRFPCTTTGMRRYLKKLQIEVPEYLEVNNEKNLRHFGKLNPDWPLRAWIGLQLEWLLWKDKKPEHVEIPKRKRGRPRKVTNGSN